MFACLGLVGTAFGSRDGRAQPLIVALRNDVPRRSVVVLRDVRRADTLSFKSLLEIRAPDLAVRRDPPLDPVVAPRPRIMIVVNIWSLRG